MTVTKIIQTIDEMLGLGIFQQAKYDEQAVQSDVRSVRLLDCCNSVLEQLYAEHMADPTRTVVEVVDGVAPLDPQTYRVLKIKDSNGCDVDFHYTSSGIAVETDGRYNVTYAKLPHKMSYEDEVVLPDPRITYRLFVYGVIAEYFRRVGDYASGDNWQQKFDDAITVTVELRKNCRMRARRWL